MFLLFHIKITWSRRDFIKIIAIIAPEYTLRQANFVTLVEFPKNCCLDVPSIDTLHKDQCKETSIIHLIFPAGGLTLCHEHKYKQLSHNCSPHFKKYNSTMPWKIQNKSDLLMEYALTGEKRARSLKTVYGKSKGKGHWRRVKLK